MAELQKYGSQVWWAGLWSQDSGRPREEKHREFSTRLAHKVSSRPASTARKILPAKAKQKQTTRKKRGEARLEECACDRQSQEYFLPQPSSCGRSLTHPPLSCIQALLNRARWDSNSPTPASASRRPRRLRVRALWWPPRVLPRNPLNPPR